MQPSGHICTYINRSKAIQNPNPVQKNMAHQVAACLTSLRLGVEPAALSPVVQPWKELLIINHGLPAFHLHTIGGFWGTVVNKDHTLASVLWADLAAWELRRCCRDRKARQPLLAEKVARATSACGVREDAQHIGLQS